MKILGENQHKTLPNAWDPLILRKHKARNTLMWPGKSTRIEGPTRWNAGCWQGKGDLGKDQTFPGKGRDDRRAGQPVERTAQADGVTLQGVRPRSAETVDVQRSWEVVSRPTPQPAPAPRDASNGGVLQGQLQGFPLNNNNLFYSYFSNKDNNSR